MTETIQELKEKAEKTIEATVEKVQETAKKVQLLMRAKAGLTLEDEERGVLIQPDKLQERTRVKMAQVIVHTQLRTLYDLTGFNIYNNLVDYFDRYLISLDGQGRAEYIADRNLNKSLMFKQSQLLQ